MICVKGSPSYTQLFVKISFAGVGSQSVQREPPPIGMKIDSSSQLSFESNAPTMCGIRTQNISVNRPVIKRHETAATRISFLQPLSMKARRHDSKLAF